jgi:dipeptidyl aminopeptidase/acylaminoacyl peptidase
LTFDPGVDRQPAWSSTGEIAFASDRGGDLDLYVVDERGGGLRRLTQDPGLDLDPSWSPEGSRLAYAHGSGSGDFDVFAIGADGGDRRLLASSLFVDHFPAWSPDGTRIAFASERGFLKRILVMPAEGEQPGQPALAVGFGTDPSWAPLPPPAGGPDIGRTVTVAPGGSRVLVAPSTQEEPSTNTVLQARLRTTSEVPVGSTIDASDGTVVIEAVTTTPDGPGTVGRATVKGGVFTVKQGNAPDSEPAFRLLPGVRPCRRARASRLPGEARMRIHARGRFRSVSHYGRGAGRGTEWVMRDRCDGTIFKVYEGLVLVRDFRRGVTVRLRAGRCYLAARRHRRDALRPRRACPRIRPPR